MIGIDPLADDICRSLGITVGKYLCCRLISQVGISKLCAVVGKPAINGSCCSCQGRVCFVCTAQADGSQLGKGFFGILDAIGVGRIPYCKAFGIGVGIAPQWLP
jgi:hypothetical protein